MQISKKLSMCHHTYFLLFIVVSLHGGLKGLAAVKHRAGCMQLDIRYVRVYYSGPGSSVGIATDYGLDGPGIESRWG